MTQSLLRFREVAQVLGVSVDKAREIARTDPAFPQVVPLGPRTNRVPAEDLARYVEGKKSNGRPVAARSASK